MSQLSLYRCQGIRLLRAVIAHQAPKPVGEASHCLQLARKLCRICILNKQIDL